MDNIKVICNSCNYPMVLESIMNASIYICELCKHEVKIISIGNEGVCMQKRDRIESYKKAIDTDTIDDYHNKHGR